MFSEFRFKNFKSFRDSSLLIEPVTLIIGANASGKSNALEGIHILSQLAKPLEIEDILDGIRGQLPGIRGGSKGAPFSGENAFDLGCTYIQGEIDCLYNINLLAGSTITDETLKINGPISANDLGPHFNDDKTFCYNNIDSMIQKISFLSNTKRGSGKSKGFDLINNFVEALEKIFILDPIPNEMKEYVSLQRHRLLPTAENLSAVIAKLIENQGDKKLLMDLLQDFPEQQIVDIDVIRTPTDDVMLKLVERIGKKEISFDVRGLSDGTLRVLAIAGALLSEPEGTTLVVEEIDTGLHPARVQKLMAFFSQISRQRKIDIIATTHNPALLNSVPREDIPGVVVCYRDPEEGDSRLVRWVDVPSYPELMAVGRIGDLMTKGLIEKATHETPEDRQKQLQQKQKWIEEELE